MGIWHGPETGPARCYRFQKNKPFIKSRYCRGVPDPKIRIYEVGNKKASVDVFPMVCHLVRMHFSSVAQESDPSGTIQVTMKPSCWEPRARCIHPDYSCRFIPKEKLDLLIYDIARGSESDRVHHHAELGCGRELVAVRSRRGPVS